jgi:hypothetical protein
MLDEDDLVNHIILPEFELQESLRDEDVPCGEWMIPA